MMCERMDAVRALKQAAKDLTSACLADALRLPPINSTPDDMKALTEKIDAALARRKQ
ncbi:hypothetical protein [Sphingobium jiangsuense]|nr:hypothetical protein [Sphingobium jiangsuense]